MLKTHPRQSVTSLDKVYFLKFSSQTARYRDTYNRQTCLITWFKAENISSDICMVISIFSFKIIKNYSQNYLRSLLTQIAGKKD